MRYNLLIAYQSLRRQLYEVKSDVKEFKKKTSGVMGRLKQMWDKREAAETEICDIRTDYDSVQGIGSNNLFTFFIIQYKQCTTSNIIFFWVVPRRVNIKCRRFGNMCRLHLHRT
jgi:hypothetical protein